MTEKSRIKLLEVIITNSSEQWWEWKVVAGQDILVVGYEATQLAARVAGNDSLFLTLSLGWNAESSVLLVYFEALVALSEGLGGLI